MAIGKFISGPSESYSPFPPDPKRPRVLEEDLVDVSIAELANSLDLLRGQRRTEELVMLMLEYSEGDGDDDVIRGEFIAVATFDNGTWTGFADGSPSDATHWLAIPEAATRQVAEEGCENADVSQGNPDIATWYLDVAPKLVGGDERQIVTATTTDAVRHAVHHASRVVSAFVKSLGMYHQRRRNRKDNVNISKIHHAVQAHN